MDAETLAEEFRLTLGQAKVYSSLLQLGSASVREIIRKTAIHRALVYDYLNQLIEKGMCAEAFVNNRNTYSAVPPSVVAKTLQERMDEERRMEEKRRKNLATLASELERLTASAEKPSVSVLYGMEGVKALFKEIASSLGKGEEDLVFIANYEGRAQFGVTILKYYKEMGKKGASARVIFDGRPETVKIGKKTAEMPFVEVRFLPAEYSTLTTMHVYRNTVCLLLFSEPDVFGLKVENKKVADGFHKHFEALWKMAKPASRFRTSRS